MKNMKNMKKKHCLFMLFMFFMVKSSFINGLRAYTDQENNETGIGQTAPENRNIPEILTFAVCFSYKQLDCIKHARAPSLSGKDA